jgi:hypothetical protein
MHHHTGPNMTLQLVAVALIALLLLMLALHLAH